MDRKLTMYSLMSRLLWISNLSMMPRWHHAYSESVNVDIKLIRVASCYV